MSRRPLTIPAISAALILAACGSSGSSSSTRGAAVSAQPVSATHSSAAAPYGAGAYGARSTAAATPAAAATERVTITTKHDRKLGVILAAGTRTMTVYMFKADHGSQSSCSGACANVWPPVTGRPVASGRALAAVLGTVKRSDGTQQVTYQGHPLYHYVKDGDAGDAYGAGIKEFGAPWYALTPSGKVIDNS